LFNKTQISVKTSFYGNILTGFKSSMMHLFPAAFCLCIYISALSVFAPIEAMSSAYNPWSPRLMAKCPLPHRVATLWSFL